MSKGKKPTNMELKTAISGLILELDDVKRALLGIDTAVTGYIKFNGHYDKWIVWMQEQIEKKKEVENESRSKESGAGTGTTGDGQLRKKTSKK